MVAAIVSGVIGLLLLILIIYVVGIYNTLVRLKNRFKNAFAQIEVQLKRRHDLIPNLVAGVKKYLEHEQETLTAVTQARNQAAAMLGAAAKDPGNAAAIANLAGAEGALTGALGRLMVTVEAYPELKADQQISEINEQLTTTENKVAFARQAFNDAVTQYNTYKQTFPPVFFAGMFGHGEDAELLEFEDSKEIQEAPKVSYD
ncbi:MAG: LemA family protein [Phycisphaeraceae bacterium]|nr:LemA family protein [Phycisphaeraceae bacterium]